MASDFPRSAAGAAAGQARLEIDGGDATERFDRLQRRVAAPVAAVQREALVAPARMGGGEHAPLGQDGAGQNRCGVGNRWRMYKMPPMIPPAIPPATRAAAPPTVFATSTAFAPNSRRMDMRVRGSSSSKRCNAA